jgi:mercuric reductase
VVPAKEVVRARVNRRPEGLFKLVADGRTGRLLGAHLVSEQAGEAIYGAVLAVKYGLKVEELAESFAPYLTMSEGLRLAALAFSREVARLSCCAG